MHGVLDGRGKSSPNSKKITMEGFTIGAIWFPVIASRASGASAEAATAGPPAGPVPVVTIPDTDTEQLGTSGHKEASSSQASDGNALRKYRIPKH